MRILSEYLIQILTDLSQPIADISVPVEVKLFDDEWQELYSVMSPSNYTFTVGLTPVVSSVSPARGGTGGGTLVTIGGSGFSDTMSEVRVACNVLIQKIIFNFGSYMTRVMT